MIQANELRIGNLVSVENKPYIITSGDIYNLDCYYKQYIKFYEPIPLTEEWVVRFGFYETSRYGKYLEFNINQEQSLRLPICKHSEKDFWYILRGSVKIKYVHNLQNLYFALTGEELKLTEK